MNKITKEIVAEFDELFNNQEKENEELAKKYGFNDHHDFWMAVFEFKMDNRYFNDPDDYPHWTDKAYKAVYWMLKPFSIMSHWPNDLIIGIFGPVIRYFDPRVEERKRRQEQ